MKASSGTNSPQQVKSRSSLGNHVGAYSNLYASQQRPLNASNNKMRSKTATRKKRNLYTSVGNYNSVAFSQVPTNGVVSKRMQNNYFDQLDKTNIQAINSAAKKRNKNTNKSYNNNVVFDDMNNYSSNLNYSANIG